MRRASAASSTTSIPIGRKPADVGTMHQFATPSSAIASSEGGGNMTPVPNFAPCPDQGDVTNGSSFARLNAGRLLYTPENKQWLRFDRVAGWLAAESGEPHRAAKGVLAEIRATTPLRNGRRTRKTPTRRN